MSFEVAADAYDSFMGRFSRLLSPQMADLAGVRPGQDALDVGCGTGALTQALVERLGAAHVTGVDPSTAFVEAARKRFPEVRIEHGSAEAVLVHPRDPYTRALIDAAPGRHWDFRNFRPL